MASVTGDLKLRILLKAVPCRTADPPHLVAPRLRERLSAGRQPFSDTHKLCTIRIELTLATRCGFRRLEILAATDWGGNSGGNSKCYYFDLPLEFGSVPGHQSLRRAAPRRFAATPSISATTRRTQ